MIPVTATVENVFTYKEFFGLSTSPFELSPDPYFMFASEKNKDVLALISQAVHQRKGFIVMTGEVGTGKTLMLRCLFELWEREQIPFAYFIGPRLSTTDFLSYITFELGIEVPDPSKGNLLRALYGFLLAQFEKGVTTVLIIDEAHQIPRNVLEEIRLLANFETAQQKLIQILLVGQPELDKKLDTIELRSLKQRITVRCQLEPLRPDEMRHYIERRLDLAGSDQAASIFPADTIRAIYRYSSGIPRLVNSVCDQALTAAYARQVRVVPVEVIEEVASQFRLDRGTIPRRTDRTFSPVGHVESPVPAPVPVPVQVQDKSRQNTPTLIVPIPRTPDPDPILGHPGAGNGAHAQTVESTSNLRTSSNSLIRESPPPPTLEPPGSPKISNQTIFRQAPAPIQSQLKRRALFSVLVVIALALPAGFIMARRQKTVVNGASPIESPRETMPAGPPVAAIKPSGASSAAQFGAASINPVAPPAATAAAVISEPAGPVQHVAPRSNVAMGKLTKPVAQPGHLPSFAELPPPMGALTKELDLGKGLSEISVPPPVVASASPSVREPKLISSVRPAYPDMARLSNTQGVVKVVAQVDDRGNVTDVMAISGPIVLREAAINAVKQWRYSPALIDGRPAAAQVTVDVAFHLN